jgi:hypothetical protein
LNNKKFGGYDKYNFLFAKSEISVQKHADKFRTEALPRVAVVALTRWSGQARPTA